MAGGWRGDFPLTNRLEGSLQLCPVKEWPGTCFLSVLCTSCFPFCFSQDQPALLAKWSAMLRGKRPFHSSIQVQSLPATWCPPVHVPASSSLTLFSRQLHPPNRSSRDYFILSAKDWLFCSKYFISNLMLLPPWDILPRITRMRLYLIHPAYCRQVFNMAELAISYTSQNLRFLFKPVTCWGPWSACGT